MRERHDPFGAHVPESESLEKHAYPLPPLRDVVETAVELEVLHRRQLSVNERLVREEPDLPPPRTHVERSAGRRQQPREERKERRLSGSVRARQEQEVPLRDVEVEPHEHAFVAEAAVEVARRDHARTSASTNAKSVSEITPFIVKNAVSRRRQSLGETSERLLPREERAETCRDSEPVERADGKPEPGGHEGHHGEHVTGARDGKRRGNAEAGGDRPKPLRPVHLEVEQRIEHVEPRHPEGDRTAQRPRLPRKRPAGEITAGADGRKPVHGAEPEVAEPRRPLFRYG